MWQKPLLNLHTIRVVNPQEETETLFHLLTMTPSLKHLKIVFRRKAQLFQFLEELEEKQLLALQALRSASDTTSIPNFCQKRIQFHLYEWESKDFPLKFALEPGQSICRIKSQINNWLAFPEYITCKLRL